MRPRGFNFTEVLFAVMILGIGFIMVAAIFPVALMQTKLTQEETAGAAIARGGANYLEQIATDAYMPVTGRRVRCLAGMSALRGGLILSSDSRYAWVPFYRRDNSWPYAQVYMIPVAARNRSIYDRGAPRIIADYTPGPNYGASLLVATLADSTSGNAINQDQVDCIEFTAGKGQNDTNDNYTAVGPGAYVIIDTVSSPIGAGARNGHIFRIGNPTRTQPGGSAYPRRWELIPGMDYEPQSGDWNNDGDLNDTNERPGPLELIDANVFVVGRELTDPTLPVNAGNPREGLGQDISAYTSFVNIH